MPAMPTTISAIWSAATATKLEIPIATVRVAAGFPSPAQDFAENALDLNRFLIRHPAATFFVRVQGESMREAGIFDGDILVVDKALEPLNGNIVIANIDGEFTVKRFQNKDGRCYLLPENPDFEPLPIEGDMTLQIFGVVLHSIHSFA